MKMGAIVTACYLVYVIYVLDMYAHACRRNLVLYPSTRDGIKINNSKIIVPLSVSNKKKQNSIRLNMYVLKGRTPEKSGNDLFRW